MELLYFGEGNGHPHIPLTLGVLTDAREVAE